MALDNHNIKEILKRVSKMKWFHQIDRNRDVKVAWPDKSPERLELLDRISKINWFHQIDFGNGVVTPGPDNSSEKLRTIKLPERLDGLTVLDVGAWDGFFSFEAEKRGAKRVLATDSFSWGLGGWATKEGFLLAREALKSEVEDRTIDVLELSPDTVGIFDVVLFLGVLYHMKSPILALEKVASVTHQQLILETHVDMLEIKRPAAAVYPFDELASDITNWWGFNPPAIEGLLKAVGFKTVKIVSGPDGIFKNRMVFHAWK